MTSQNYYTPDQNLGLGILIIVSPILFAYACSLCFGSADSKKTKDDMNETRLKWLSQNYIEQCAQITAANI
jgi:hypothetical protein